jgi:hypothetical protein
MANKDTSKYGKYIVTKLKENINEASWAPKGIRRAEKGRGGRVLWLDSEVVPGAFYVETAWDMPQKPTPEEAEKSSTQPHTHDFDEVLCLFGTNMDDPYDLGGEYEFWLGDEKHIITKSCIIFIPKGLRHCPLIARRVDRPIFGFTLGPGKMYV